MEEVIKHINDTNASYRSPNAGDAKNTDLFLDNDHYDYFKESGDKVIVRFQKENLSKAILFIASILPRKYDNSAMHKSVSYSSKFVYEQLALLDGYFMENGIAVESKTQIWNARKDVPQKNGKIDNRFYFNGLLEDFTYIDSDGNSQKAKFTLRNYLAGGYSDVHFKKANDGIFDVTVTNVQEAYYDDKENGLEEIENIPFLDLPLQQIYFGAPGTGKSHEIKDQIKKHKSFRITFHPDTDYSSFVGAYKPTSVEVRMRDMAGHVIIEDGKEVKETKIVYEYVKQAFLNAYIEAWKEQEKETPQPVYLVIEEINRGNCAQIFGDIFQLLDRNSNGFSDYAIVPDADLSRHVKKDLEKLVIVNKEVINAIYEECEEDMVDKVVNGKVLLLPNNLYIWATMNTSDQSLFPIDSAFKRRWDWKYIKIADAHKNWQIKIGTKTYDWWKFVQAINYFVFDATQSEDKNLGYFFAKAKDSIINAETFVSKVIFYLYTDVFKDYGFSGDIFKGANDDEMTFQSFYNADGSASESQIIRFIENVMFSDALPESLKATAVVDDEDVSVYDEDEAVGNRTTSNRDKYMVNGVGSYGKCRAPFEAVKTYASINPQMTASEIAEKWTNLNVNHLPHLVETEQQFEQRAVDSTDTKFRDKAKQLVLANGEIVYVSNQFNPVRINELISKLATADLGVNISLIEA